MILMKSESINYYLLMLLAVFLPSGFYKASHAVLIVLFFVWLLQKNYKKYGQQLKLKQAWLPALMYFLVVIGLSISENKSRALSTLSISLPYLIPMIIIGSPSLEIRQRNNIIRVFIVSLAACLLVADVYALADIWMTGQSYTVAHGVYTYHKLTSYGLTGVFGNWHPTYVSAFCLWSVGFMVFSYSSERSHRLFTPLKSILLLIFLTVNIILLNSVVVIGALIILAGYGLVRYLAARRVNTFYLLTTVLVLTFTTAYVGYANPMNNEKIRTLKERGFRITDKEGERNFLTIRLAKWISHYDIFKEHPLFGITAGDIKEERVRKYREKGFDTLAEINFNAHNQYLEMLSRFGIIGFAVFLSFLLVPLFQKPLSQLYISLLISVLIIFITESFLERQQGLLAFLFFYALLSKPLPPTK